MRAWACAECGKVKRVARGKSDGGICRAKEVSQAGADRLKSGDGMHKSHCIWKGWGKEGHPPTNVCVRCGCFSTFRCVNLRTICKGGFASEAARRRVGLGKHPTSGQALEGWCKVGDGTEGVQGDAPLEVPSHEDAKALRRRRVGVPWVQWKGPDPRTRTKTGRRTQRTGGSGWTRAGTSRKRRSTKGKVS